MSNWKVNRRATEEDLKPLYKRGYLIKDEIKGAWIVNNTTTIVQFNFPSKDNIDGAAYNRQHNFIGSWDFKGPLGKAIEDWEFKHNLSPSTLKTFSDIIDEL